MLELKSDSTSPSGGLRTTGATGAAVPLRRVGSASRLAAPSSDDTNRHREADDCYEEEVVKHIVGTIENPSLCIINLRKFLRAPNF